MDSNLDIYETRRMRRIVEQLQNVGWAKVQHIDKNFHTLILVYRDENTEKVCFCACLQ